LPKVGDLVVAIDRFDTPIFEVTTVESDGLACVMLSEVAVSLAVAAIKIAALRSLRGRTSAGQAVFDSAVEPFDALRDQGRRSL
jgi:hypothetical protein